MDHVVRTCAVLGLALGLAGCGREAVPLPQPVGTFAGWYWQHAGAQAVQLCGTQRPLVVLPSSRLRDQARVFGLEDDMPVYVRLEGRFQGRSLEVARILQFGSPVPVKNCAMNGVVLP